MSAGEAQPEVHPPVAGLDAFVADVVFGLQIARLREMLAIFHWPPFLSVLKPYRAERLQREVGQQAPVSVKHNREARRFEAQTEAGAAFLSYLPAYGKIVLTHTEVPLALEGKGVGGVLARAALEYARAEKLSVTPRCPFVASYIGRHPEYLDLVNPADRAYLHLP